MNSTSIIQVGYFKKYSLIIIVALFLIGIIVTIAFPSESLTSILGILIPVIFIFIYKGDFVRTRIGNFEMLIWLLQFLAAQLILLTLGLLSSYVFDLLEYDYRDRNITSEVLEFIGATIIFYFLITFVQLILKRVQDINQPGHYFFLGIIPILSWFIGVKFYKSGYKVIGILVFLNLIISIPFILFWPSDKGANYYGISPVIYRLFQRKKLGIKNSKFLTDQEKSDLMKKLSEDYQDIENRSIEEFKRKEIESMVNNEKIKLNIGLQEKLMSDQELNILVERMQIFYLKIVEEKLNLTYVKTDWG